MEEYFIHSINGPVIIVRGGRTLPRMSLIYVGEQKLFGEVVSSSEEDSVVQIYMRLRRTARRRARFSDICADVPAAWPRYDRRHLRRHRPSLRTIEQMAGSRIAKGINLSSLDGERLWDVTVEVKDGDTVAPSDIRPLQRKRDDGHRSMIPPGVSEKSRKRTLR
jgi:V/A-type H+-transporting ATPase subunit A